MKKKTLVVLLALVLALSMVLTACDKGNDEPAKTDAPAVDKTEAPADDGQDDTPETEAPETDGTEAPDDGEEGDQPKEVRDTLVVASDEFNEIFSPFFSNTAYDNNVWSLTSVGLLGLNAYAQPDDSGASDYIEPEIVRVDPDDEESEVEKVIYRFKLRDGLVFSDGEPVTIDDVIFTYKVYLDPTYTGNTTLYTLPIVGAMEYKYDTEDYQAGLDKIAAEVEAYEPTDEEIDAKATELGDLYAEYGDTKEDFLKDGKWFEDDTLPELINDKKLELTQAWIDGNLADGIDFPEIEGITKINDQEMEIEMYRLDPTAIYKVGVAITPEHYYGEGFEKGNLDGVKAKDKEPMGAGPYIFKGFANNVVSFEANPNYWKGEPKIKNFKYQVVSQTNKLEATARGDVDISDPTADPDMVAEVQKHDNLHMELVDNNGYGYIGIHAERITDKLVRQGIFHLLDRRPAVDAYYGELASIIERPISQTSWAYPQGAEEYYGFDPEKALEKFKEAGYEQVDGKLMKGDVQLHISATYPGGQDDSHPVKPVFSTLKEEGEKLGMIVDLQNMDGGAFFAALDAKQLDMWAAAWQAAVDPDMTQIYKSDSSGNKYGINNADLDKLIAEGLQTVNIEERKAIYSDALDIIMEEAVEMPFYQRKNMFIYNTDVVDIDTLPAEMTPYWDHMAEIEKLELVQE